MFTIQQLSDFLTGFTGSSVVSPIPDSLAKKTGRVARGISTPVIDALAIGPLSAANYYMNPGADGRGIPPLKLAQQGLMASSLLTPFLPGPKGKPPKEAIRFIDKGGKLIRDMRYGKRFPIAGEL